MTGSCLHPLGKIIMYKADLAFIVLLALLPTLTLAAPTLPITLTANLEQPVCPEGQPVMLSLALHNGGTERLVIGGGAFEESSFQLTVTDGAGRTIPRTALGERVLTPPMEVSWNPTVELKPGQTISYRFNLARLFDLTRTGTYSVGVSRTVRQSALPPGFFPGEPQTTLTAGPLKVRLVEDAAGKSGPTALTHPPGRRTFFYATDENYSHWTADGKYLTGASVVSGFQVWPDGSVSSTLNAPTFVKRGSGSVVATPDGRFLYVGSEGTVAEFRVGAGGVLVPLSPPVPTPGFFSPRLMDPKGRFLYASDTEGTTLYAVGRDGRLTVTDRVTFQEWAKNPNQSVGPTISSVLDPTGTFLYACHNGIVGYRLDAAGRVAAALGTVRVEEQQFEGGLAVGEQDQAVVLTPSGRFAYVLAWKWIGPPDNVTARYEDRIVPTRVRQDGSLDPLPGLVTPRDQNGDAYGATSLAVDPTGSVLLALDSQSDSITPYRIEADGSLTALRMTSHVGGPITALVVPGSPLVYVLNRNRPSLAAFRLDAQSGLTPGGVDMPAYGIGFASGIAVANALTPPKLGPVTGGLEMSILLAGDVQPAVKPMVLTVTLKNVTKHPIRLGTAGADMASFRLSLVGPQPESPGEPVASPVPLLAAGHDLLDAPGLSHVPVVLPPGGERQYRFVLSRLADLTVAGNYTVQITRTQPHGAAVASPLVPFRLTGPYDSLIRGADQSIEVL